MLYLVPTPIGNLSDMSFRAVEVLKQADFILAEDTRTSGKLLKHFGIDTPVKAYHAHNEHRVTGQIITELEIGKSIALISDAGTPGISDPGYMLVRACIDNELEFTCLPGATAIVPALVMSGFPSHAFHFEGFLPQKKGRRKRWNELKEIRETLVLFESPHRLQKCLEEVGQNLGPDKPVAVIREISKQFEEQHRGSAADLSEFFEKHPGKQRGEIVIVINNSSGA